MPGMPDLILTAPVFGRITSASRVPGAWQHSILDDIIDDLNDDTQTLLDVGVKYAFYKDATQAEHLRKDWLNGDGDGFWPTLTDTETIIRKGLAKALELFQSNGKPIEMYWVMSDPDENGDRWEMSTTVCADINLVLFHTPNAKCETDKKDSSWIWITKVNSTGKVVTRKAKTPDPGGKAAKKKAAKKALAKAPGKGGPKGPKKGAKTGAKKKAKR